MTIAAQGLGGPPSISPERPLAPSLLNRLRSQPQLPLMLAGAALVAVIGALLLWARQPEYRVLYANLGEADGGRIIAELEKREIPYRLSEGGQALLVPAEQMHSLRLQLAEQGLPQGGNVGFELLDTQAFGVSQFAEQINFQRGLEGELARTIESLGPVAKARVHLAMAKQSVFVREREPARASVVLNLHPGRELGDSQVSAIVHLVSSSVPNLAVDAVTVVDQNGRLLSQSASARDLNSSQLGYIEEVERSYQRRIENILTPILGARSIRAQVVAQIDFSNREQTAERYTPNQQPGTAAIRSQQLSEDQNSAGELGQGIPGALTNSPPNSPPSPPNEAAKGGTVTNGAGQKAAQGQPDAASLRRDNTVNYEVDRSIEHVQHNRGSIQRLSAAVVIDHRATLKDGKWVREPLAQEELEQIERLVRQAMGFSSARGDELEIMNSPFAETTDDVEGTEWWKTPEFYNLAASLSRYLLVAFIALLLWLLVLRPLKRRHAQTLAAQAAAKAEAEAEALAATQLALAAPQDEEEHEETGTHRPRRKSAAYEHNLQSLRKMASEDPRVVAMVIRGWMKND